MSLSVGSVHRLLSFKHDHSLQRIWTEVTVLEENENYIVVANRRTKVVEANGRYWYTKEPSVSFFFKDHWYNVIGIIKDTGICFYCNISSPVLYDEEAIKYIDYDLDIKVQTDYSYRVLDWKEYRKHRHMMNSPKLLINLLYRATAQSSELPGWSHRETKKWRCAMHRHSIIFSTHGCAIPPA